LLGQIDGESALDGFRSKLVTDLSRARDNEEAARSACASSDPKRGGRRLKGTIRAMIQYARHLKSLRARKKLPAALRNGLLAAGNPIESDLRVLKRALQCPADGQ